MSLFKTQRYTQCLNVLKTISKSSILENYLWQNNLNTVEISLGLLSGETNKIHSVEEELMHLLQKIRCIPVTEEILVAELCVVCNIITCHLIQGICPVDQCHMILLPSIQKCWNLVKEGNDICATADTETRSGNLIYSLMENLMSSAFSGPLGRTLLEACLRWATVLLLNRNLERASKILSLVDVQSRNTYQEEPVPGLLLPLEICLLGGEGCSPDTSVVEEGHLLSALCLFPGDSDGCLGHLQKLTTQAWLPYTKLMEAHLEYKAECYMEAIIILSETAALPFKMTKRLTALHCDLFGKCLSQLNKPHSAIQKFREAIDADFSYLLPLYNIATQYRQLGLKEAELEALNLLVTAVENREMKPESSESIFFQHVVNKDISLTQALFYLGQACEIHHKYDIAAEKYVHLISLINNNTFEKMRGCEMLNIPSISDIYRSTIVSLLKAKKYHQCEILCAHVLSCQPTSVLDLSSILSQHSQKPANSQVTSTQARACMGSFAFGNCSSQASDKETSMEESKVSYSQGKRKRLASEEKSDPGNEEQMEMVFVHLYKAEAQVYLNKIEEAIESLDIVLEALRNTCSSTTMPMSESSSQDSKRQRLSSDGAAKPGTSSLGSASIWREVGHQASHTYCCLGIRLGQQNKLTDALHFLRMSLQMEKENLTTLYNCAMVLWRLDRQKEAAMLWCKGRQLDIQGDSFQMAGLIKRKKAALKDTQGNDFHLEVKATVADPETLQLDVQCLEFLFHWKHDR